MRKIYVLDSIVPKNTKKVDNSCLPWKSVCKYMIGNENNVYGETKQVVAYGSTKTDAIVTAISMAYRAAIREAK